MGIVIPDDLFGPRVARPRADRGAVMRAMRFNSEPVVWVNSLLGLLSALVVAGLIQQDDFDRYGPLVTAGVPILFLLANTAAAFVIRARTAPVDEREKVKVLSLSADGVYRRPSQQVVADARRNVIRKLKARTP